MKKKLKGWFITAVMLAVYSSSIVVAQEVHQVETNGTIGFTGVYEPIGTPDPKPPESIGRPPITDIAKPGGTLPQTNDTGSYKSIWLGIFIISFVFLLWKRKNKQIQN